jgi:perosamine synthetase
MVATRFENLHERMRRFKNQGLPGGGREYWHEFIGFNYRMTNISAAIGLAQIERANEFIEKKRRIAAMYRSHLKGLPVTMQAEPKNVFHTYWMVCLLCHDTEAVRPLRSCLDAEGIETRPVFPPVHTMPVYYDGKQRLPITEDISGRGINLPSWPGLEEKDIAFIANVIRRFYGSIQ